MEDNFKSGYITALEPGLGAYKYSLELGTEQREPFGPEVRARLQAFRGFRERCVELGVSPSVELTKSFNNKGFDIAYRDTWFF